jgi:hypothetical protein
MYPNLKVSLGPFPAQSSGSGLPDKFIELAELDCDA